jgi:hypothetical protein
MYGIEKILKGMLGSEEELPNPIKNKKKIKALVHDAWGTPSSPSVGPMLYV